MGKRLYRSREQRIFGGVCGGIAEYFNVDVTLVRLICLVTVIFGGGGLLFYLIAWIIIPENPYQTGKAVDKTKSEMGEVGSEKEIKDNRANEVLGWGLIILGLLILLPKLFPFVSFRMLWPIVLIGLGIWILLKRD
ncbi:MAG: phage shock protein [Caldanaerobacter sp.]|uniref:PspC domain-containing protein n=1 Tax=Caldanaerobacter sp. TaxID=2930036 RepID=UPI0024AA42C9|nr:PspC domain-containing protein [Caldanaerobacter sp.]MDI3518623.1 phage shock protein [Caldanaerobacter sp.]